MLERRRWPVAAVIDEYETYSGRAIGVFASLQVAAGDKVIPMADFGMQPMSLLPSTFLFDGYTHFRGDILGPNGRVERPEPPRDEQRLRPTVEWMLAVLPWMCADALGAVVDRPVALDLAGPGGGGWTIAPGGPDGRVAVVEEPAPGDAAAVVRSTDHDFAMWGTRRTPWRDHVVIEGDADYAASVLDAINIV